MQGRLTTEMEPIASIEGERPRFVAAPDEEAFARALIAAAAPAGARSTCRR
jgi:hypothetical protein